jgi:hypothetical protein
MKSAKYLLGITLLSLLAACASHLENGPALA